MAERRYAITPLVEAMRLEPGASVSRALGISGSKLTDYAVLGMDERTAERLAVRAGFPAVSVWPEMLDQAIADIERECEAPDCSETFVPKFRGAHRRFCCDNCRERTRMRRTYQEDAEARERKKAAQRRYDGEVREAARRRAERRAA